MAEPVDIPPPPLISRLLGHTELRLGDRILTDADFTRRAARHLLVLLLISPGHTLPRDRVLDLLWPEAALDSATNLIALALHRLRRTLEPTLATGRASAYVATTGGAIRLRLPPGSLIDADAFEDDLRAARRLPDEGRRAPIRAALADYAGDLVADEPYLDWLIPRREQLAQLRLGAVVELADLDLAAGKPLASEPTLLALLRDDPAQEAVHRALIRAYAAAAQPERTARQLDACRAVIAEHLDVALSPETLAALDQTPLGPLSPARWWQRVPAPLTRMIGRRRECDEIADALLGGEHRLVTLVGPGGIGKTHLAQEVGRLLEGDFPDGVVWVPLAALRDPALVPAALARGLGVSDDGAMPLVEALAEAAADRRLLVVVDNLEQVVEGAPVLSRMLAASLGSAVLATSRQRLRLRGEHVIDVEPLPARTDGVALFLARAVDAGVRLNGGHDAVGRRDVSDTVVEVCRRLDGIPLAIELAAATARQLTPEQILDRLGRRLDLLVDGPRDAEPRQRTMRAAIAWSDELLSASQRTTFRRLGVFAGGAARDLIDQVVAPERADAQPRSDAAIDGDLLALVEAQLIRREETGSAPRYRILETVRAYALERLEATGELEVAAHAHLAAVVALAERADAGLVGPDQVAWLDRLEDDHDNLRAAVTWAVDRGDPAALRIVAAVWRFLSTHGHGVEWSDRADQAIAGTEEADPLLVARGLRAAGILRDDLDDYDGAETRYRAALDRLRDNPAAGEIRGQLSIDLGNLDRNRARYPEARAHYEEAVVIAAAGFPRIAASAESNLAVLDMFEGRLDAAADRIRTLLVTTDDPYHGRILRSNLALVHLHQEEYASARPLLEEVLVAVREADDREGIAGTLAMLAEALDHLGESGGSDLREEAIDRFAALGDRAGEVAARAAQIGSLRDAGYGKAVFAVAEPALTMVRPVDDRSICLDLLEQLGSPLVDVGRAELAARLLAATEVVRLAHDLPRPPVAQRSVVDLAARLAATLAPDTLADASAAGAALTLDAALHETLAACRDILAP